MPLSVQSILISAIDGTKRCVDSLEISLQETFHGKGRYLGIMRDAHGTEIARAEIVEPLREEKSFLVIGHMLAEMGFVFESDCVRT